MLNGLQINHFTVQLLQWTLLITSTSSNEIKVRSDANIITSLLEKIMKSYIESNQIIVDKPWRRLEDINEKIRKTKIENAIRLTVIKLKPLLKDSEYINNIKIETDNSIKLEGSDETTIIELVPDDIREANARKTKELTDTFQKKIEKYKLLRHNITKLLGTIKTDNSTKKLVTRTLDEMLALLIERQCPLKNEGTGHAMNKFLKDTRKAIESVQKIGKEGLASLREGYWEPFKGVEIHDQTNGPQNMEDMKRFVYQILINSWSVVDQYRLSCFLRRKNKAVDADNRDCPGRNCHRSAQRRAFSNNFDRDSNTKDTNQCDFFVCTDELRTFLTKTYKSLNDTAVATFSNYAAMYMRDVKTETKIDDDNIVSRELKNLRVSAEIKVHKTFMDEMENFAQDALKTKKEVSIQLISNFIRGIIGQIKSSVYTLVWQQLTKKAKLFLTIRDDLTLNLRVDMDNLNQQIADKMCGSFVMCNGKPNGNETRRFNNRNPKKDVYVQLEISLDDRVKDSIARLSQQNRKSLQGLKNITYGFGKSMFNAIDRRRYSLVNITRTTVGSSATTEGSSENGLEEPFF